MTPRAPALLVLVTFASCAGPSLDSPSASCRTNPAYCPKALLVDDAAEAALAVRPPPPMPAPVATATTAPVATGESLGWVGTAAASGTAVVLNDARSPDAEPGVDASPSPPKGSPDPRPGSPLSKEGSGQPPGDPPCVHIGTSGSGAFRGDRAPPGRMTCTYQCGNERVVLEVWGRSSADCERPEQFARATRRAAQQRRDAEGKLKGGR